MPELQLEQLLSVEGTVPVLFALKRREQSYLKELEYDVRRPHTTLKKSVVFLIDHGLVKTVPYEGKAPNVDSAFMLTECGESVASCLLDCQKKLQRIMTRQ